LPVSRAAPRLTQVRPIRRRQDKTRTRKALKQAKWQFMADHGWEDVDPAASQQLELGYAKVGGSVSLSRNRLLTGSWHFLARSCVCLLATLDPTRVCVRPSLSRVCRFSFSLALPRSPRLTRTSTARAKWLSRTRCSWPTSRRCSRPRAPRASSASSAASSRASLRRTNSRPPPGTRLLCLSLARSALPITSSCSARGREHRLECL
jgi:hypothetical protein